jgi:hypothetical protein
VSAQVHDVASEGVIRDGSAITFTCHVEWDGREIASRVTMRLCLDDTGGRLAVIPYLGGVKSLEHIRAEENDGFGLEVGEDITERLDEDVVRRLCDVAAVALEVSRER